MTITLNGQPRELAAPAYTVATLLEELGLGGKPVVVELNEEAVFPADYPQMEVNDGAKVEVVTLAAGG